ncbi:hypothetical protein [Acinetobacter sp. YH12023]|uniref:hypothetical protein n=1 Tax=Acinetobacter sp. YH12023 TaxID=2601041 RepID=UPI0015D24C44|nr:hypothetical protein [Acinetobacter sp. YH12023]
MKALIILVFSLFLTPYSNSQEINKTHKEFLITTEQTSPNVRDIEKQQNLILANQYNKSINPIKEILIPIGLSIFSGFVFWVVFQLIPLYIRKSKLRPKIEDDLLYINNTINHLIDLAMAHAESTTSMFHKEIANYELTLDDLHMGLMNKSLNKSYLVDIFSDNIVIGELVYKKTETINTKIDRIFYFNDQLSSDEILVLEKIHQALYKYHFSDFNRPYVDTRDGRASVPADPSLSYLRYFFFEIYQLKKELEKILISSRAKNKSILFIKLRYLKNNNQTKKAIKILKKAIKNTKDDTIHLRWILFSILYLVDRKNSLILLKELLNSSNIISYRGYLRDCFKDVETSKFIKLNTNTEEYEKFIQNEQLEESIKQSVIKRNTIKLESLKLKYNRALN